jgi:mono/diheme cytochrome c family protein
MPYCRPPFSIVAAILSALPVIGALAQTGTTQGNVPKIWGGVYFAAQAERGKALFQETCTTCHNFDLKGNSGRGPALVGDPFMENWETESLNALYTKMKTTMPRNNPGTLTEESYLNLLAFILQTNGYPEGTTELSTAVLGDIYFLKRDGTGTKVVPNFAMVSMVGCLARADSRWLLTHTSEPAITEERAATEAELKDAAASPLGEDTFRLVSANAHQPEIHKGNKVLVKGLLYRARDDKRLNLTALQPLGSNCSN